MMINNDYNRLIDVSLGTIRALLTMSRVGIEAGRAGNNLRNVMYKMSREKETRMIVNIDKAWRPITITLESEDEFRSLTDLVAMGLKNDSSTISHKIYAKLDSIREMLNAHTL